MAESEVETRDGKRRGFLSSGIKQDLYAANGERFREKVFIERILVRYRTDSYRRHTVSYEGYLSLHNDLFI